MKTRVLGLLIGSQLVFFGAALAGVSSGGERIIGKALLLKVTHEGGFVAPEFRDTQCEISEKGNIEKYSNGQLVDRSEVNYSDEIPNITELKQLILEASIGRIVSGARTNPDAGSTTYIAYQTIEANSDRLPRGPYVETVMLQIESVFGKVNNSNSAEKLVEFLKANCN